MDTNNNKIRTILDMIDSVDLEMLQMNVGYAKQLLKEEGIDVSEELAFAGQYMKKIRFMANAIFNKKQDHELMEAAFSKVKEAIKENAQKTADALFALLQSKTPSVQYRKLENWTDEEIRDVLADIDLVQLMEELPPSVEKMKGMS